MSDPLLSSSVSPPRDPGRSVPVAWWVPGLSNSSWLQHTGLRSPGSSSGGDGGDCLALLTVGVL